MMIFPAAGWTRSTRRVSPLGTVNCAAGARPLQSTRPRVSPATIQRPRTRGPGVVRQVFIVFIRRTGGCRRRGSKLFWFMRASLSGLWFVALVWERICTPKSRRVHKTLREKVESVTAYFFEKWAAASTGLCDRPGHLDGASWAHHDAFIRTTVTLDRDVERLLRDAMHRSKSGFKQTINAAIRAGLSQTARAKNRSFVLKARPLGLRAGLDPAGFNKLADELETDAVLQKSRTTGRK